MELLPLTILIQPTPIPGMCQGRPWPGVRELLWVQPPGALGAATGAIGATAIGTTATSTSTTKIISTKTTTRTSTAVKPVRATRGSTIRNIAGAHRMQTRVRPINMAAELALALAELELPVAQQAQELERPALKLRRALVEAQLEPSPVEQELELSPVQREPSRVEAELELGPVVVKLQLSPAEAVVIR